MKKGLLNFWPFLAILVAVLIFFYPVWLKDLVPIPADFIVGVYYPWLDYVWGGFSTGVPVKNPITADVVSFIYPMQMYSVELLKKGIVALWNPFIFTGTPLLANFQSAQFSPTNFLYFLFPQLTAWSLQIMLQPFLAALFLYLLLRQFDLSRLAAVAGGLFFAFAGFITIWMQWNGHSLVAAFFPLIFYLSLKWFQSSRLVWGILISLSLALQFFSGYPQIILYEFLSIGLMILIFEPFFLRNKLKTSLIKILGLAFFVTIGIGLASVQNLPAFELLSYSSRSVETIDNAWAFFPWQAIITFLAPDYFGNHATGNYWGPADYTLTTSYSGVVVIVLAILGLLAYFKINKGAKFGLILILTSLAIALPNPLSIVVKESGLLGLQAASAHRALILSNLGFAILAAFGVNAVLLGRLDFIQILRSTYIPCILLVGTIVGTFFTTVWLKKEVYFSQPSIQDSVVNLQVGLRNLVLPILFLILTIVILSLCLKIKKLKKILLTFLISLAVFELFRFGWKFTPFSYKEMVYPNTPVIDFLQNQQKPFRVAAEDVIPINLLMDYKIDTIEGYDAVYPLSIAQYLATLNSGQPDATPQGRYGSVSNVDSPLLDIVNTRFILALKRDEKGRPDRNGTLPEKYQKQFLRQVFEDRTVVVLENTRFLPRAKMFYQWEVVNDKSSTLGKLVNNYPVQDKVILEEAPGIDISQVKGSVKNVTILDNRKLVQVDTDGQGLLFISDINFPGWKVFINGKQEKIITANYNLMAVPIKHPGVHTIEFKYEPDSFEIGKMLSLVSGTILMVLLLISYLKVKRQ